VAARYNEVVRIGVIATLLPLAVPASARAEPPDRLETSAFFGAEYFPSDTNLGASQDPEQRPQSSPLFGARLTYFALPSLLHGDRLHLDVGTEAELALAAAWTGYGFADHRMSYFSPVFGWRGAAIVRLAGIPGGVAPHAVLGAGGATVVSDSPYMRRETEAVLVWGVGASLGFADRWQLRADVRQGVMGAHGPGVTSTFEAELGVATTFGLARRSQPLPHGAEVVHAAPVSDGEDRERDRDGDGIPDRLDTCPTVPETVNGIEDEDGCPERDRDGDHIVDALDRCPDDPEDFDHFQDEDGCPDPDNDKDGIPDGLDACPNEPETVNGFYDEDGCPDKVPAAVEAALATATAVRFESDRARITPAAKKSLDRAIAQLREHPMIRVQMTVHMNVPGDDKAKALARRRAGALKGYLLEQGVADDQVLTVVGDPMATAQVLDVTLRLR
jgi:outer membrane protein OmpA-like peptidoglycan-associated protein